MRFFLISIPDSAKQARVMLKVHMKLNCETDKRRSVVAPPNIQACAGAAMSFDFLLNKLPLPSFLAEV